MTSQSMQVYHDSFDRCHALLSQVFQLDPDAPIAASATSTHSGDEDVTLESLPQALVHMVESTAAPDQEQASYGICLGMMTLANTNPTYIDAFLRVYLKAVELSSDQRLNSSASTLAFQIVMIMSETAHTGYRTNDWCQPLGIVQPGKCDLLDASNINFTHEEIEEQFNEVLRISQRQASESNAYIIRAALYARFSVFIEETKPQWLKGYGINDFRIEVQLKKADDIWIKTDLIAALVRLRGYAKSLFEQFAKEDQAQTKMGEWQALLKQWIYDPELNKTNDAIVKHHIILALKNLQEGPFNETSKELFNPRDWFI